MEKNQSALLQIFKMHTNSSIYIYTYTYICIYIYHVIEDRNGYNELIN